MAKLKLGNRPKNFKKTVTVDLLDGTKGSIELVYKYKTRTEFGAFLDQMFADAGVKPAVDADAKVLIAEIMEKTRNTNADYIMAVCEGWNLDEEFERDAVAQLCDELPGVANAIMETYRTAITEGRLGN